MNAIMLEVFSATYGPADVTNQIRSYVKDNQLRVKASNDIFGDPEVGKVKTLTVNTSFGTYSAIENTFLFVADRIVDRLGIFYSNNNVDKVVSESVLSLTKFRENADILTCVWKPIEGNPFHEIIAHTKSSIHLNIIIQILQLLYAAKQSSQYKYVSFLEHDVLYPEGYFNFPDFSNEVIVNMNYKGLCSTGFQEGGKSEPLHQMTMVFEDAVSHFEKLVLDALRDGNAVVEPAGLRRRHWSCANPPLHINHGRNFTSHCFTYSKETHEHDPYWGNSLDLINKLGLN